MRGFNGVHLTAQTVVSRSSTKRNDRKRQKKNTDEHRKFNEGDSEILFGRTVIERHERIQDRIVKKRVPERLHSVVLE